VRRLLARFRLRRRGARPRIVPTVASLNDLPKDAPALKVHNAGREAAYNVVVSIRVRQSAFQFDEVAELAPHAEAPLLHQTSAGRFRFEEASPSTNWFRIMVRAVLRDTGAGLRIPLAIRYRDASGERTRNQTLHCDEQFKLRVTNG
jgi:hypothetical protein